MSEDQSNSQSTQQLSVILYWNNYLDFKRVLYSYAVRFGFYVVGTVNDFLDFNPPVHPGVGAGIDAINNFNRDEKAYERYKKDCALL
jgi:hypothetical protein